MSLHERLHAGEVFDTLSTTTVVGSECVVGCTPTPTLREMVWFYLSACASSVFDPAISETKSVDVPCPV
jgi:hypothetical protein